jgi:hypothetical protein
MATETNQTWRKSRSSRKRRRHKAYDQEKLNLLRMELHTIMEQIRILDREMEEDPCLSSRQISIILGLLDGLKQDLQGTKLRIRELKGSTAA